MHKALKTRPGNRQGLISLLTATLLALPVAAQDSGGGFVQVYDSPVPAERRMPPEVAPSADDGAETGEAQPALPGGTVVPDPADDDAGQPSVTVLRPGEEGAVRVVFGQDRQPPDQPPLTTSEDPAQARWREERDRRFRRAPASQGTPASAPGTGPLEPINAPDTDLLAGAVLRELDKMTGQVTTVTIPVGGEARFSRLVIRLDACRAPDGGAQHGTMAFLRVWDTESPDQPVFSGWMFAESPALSAMDHPRFDVWLLGCTDGTPAAAEN